jgi:hypothetical protein
MKKLNFGSIFICAVITSIVFLVAEIIVEGLVYAAFGYSEGELLKEHLGKISVEGSQYIIITLIYLFVFSSVAIWVYALLLPQFNNWIKTALIVSVIVLLLVYMPIINFVNLGFLPLTVFLMSLLFNLIEIPAAIIIGSAVYSPKEEE